MSRSAAVSLTPPPSRLADLTTIAAAFMQAFAPGLPRYLQLQNAIIRLIQSGELRAGAQLPPDQQLTGALDVSLGTVQKAFAGLASDGWISREHGRGTFIAQPRQPVTELWHYRFRDSEGDAMLPVYSRLLKRRHVAADERVRRSLGEDPKGFIEIERLVDIGGKFTCYSELYLPAGRFSRILEIPITAIESVNLKKLFADEFGAPTISVEQSIRACRLEPDVAKLIGQPKRACGMVLEATAFTYGRAAISFQRIHIPQSDCPLDVSPMPSAPRTLRQ
jgi:GntR family transcriptional regulator